MKINRKTIILLILLAMFSSSCTLMKNRSIKIEESSQGARAVITISATLQSYFDPDGFSREYKPHVTIRVFGEGKNMSYRNNPGTTFKFGKDFDVDIDYCSGGYLWISEDGGTLGIALFDVDAPTGFGALKDFNGSYPITKSQANLLLTKK